MRLTLKNKTRLLSAVAILGFGVFGAIVLNRLLLVTSLSSEIAEALMPLATIAAEARFDVVDYRLQEARHLGFVRAEDMAVEETLIQRQNKAVAADFAAYAARLPAGEDRGPITRLQAQWEDFVAHEEPMLAASRANRKAEAIALYRGSAERMFSLRPQIEDLYSAITRRAGQVSAQAQQTYGFVRHLVLALLGFGLFAGLAGALYFERTVTRGILRLAGCMTRLAEGDHTVDIPLTARPDEIGAMAGTVQTFKEHAIAIRAMEAASEELLRAGEAERAVAETERLAKLTRQAILVDALMSGFRHVGAGDLTFELTIPFSPAVDKLRLAFNDMILELRDRLAAAAGYGGAVGAARERLGSAAEELSQCQQQSGVAVAQIGAALREVSATLHGTAQGGAQARRLAATAAAEVGTLAAVVHEAVSAMGEIDGSSRQIGNIIGMIDEIAFQTNLLALNAGVEAARAGEAGRGFAIVATEVRGLAQRAARAAEQIKTLVDTSMQQVANGVRLVGQTGQALERIRAGVGEINTSIAAITAASAEADASGGVAQMEQLVERQGGVMSEAITAIGSLGEEIGALQGVLAQFHIEEHAMEMAA